MTRTLSTERLILRRPAAQDARAVTDFYMSDRSAFVGGDAPEFRACMSFYGMLGHWDHRGYGLWAVTSKDTDAILGLVGPFFPIGWPETEFGWLMFEGSEGKGYAAEAARAALRDTRDHLGWETIVHYIHPDNARSIALAERLGAVLDPSAPTPDTGSPCLVYRQPTGGTT